MFQTICLWFFVSLTPTLWYIFLITFNPKTQICFLYFEVFCGYRFIHSTCSYDDFHDYRELKLVVNKPQIGELINNFEPGNKSWLSADCGFNDAKLVWCLLAKLSFCLRPTPQLRAPVSNIRVLQLCVSIVDL